MKGFCEREDGVTEVPEVLRNVWRLEAGYGGIHVS